MAKARAPKVEKGRRIRTTITLDPDVKKMAEVLAKPYRGGVSGLLEELVEAEAKRLGKAVA